MNQVAKVDNNHSVAQSGNDQSGGINIVGLIDRMMSMPELDLDRVDRLISMHERMQSQQAVTAFNQSFAKMQKDLKPVEKRGKAHNSRYALWEDINESIRSVIGKHGFSLTFKTEQSDDLITVTAILLHEQGHSMQTSKELPYDTSGSKNAVQAIGSSTSYGKRYAACDLLNITTKDEDDDGQAGGSNLISVDQFEEIQALVDEVGADVQAMCQYLQVQSIKAIPVSKYARAISLLKQKKAKQNV